MSLALPQSLAAAETMVQRAEFAAQFCFGSMATGSIDTVALAKNGYETHNSTNGAYVKKELVKIRNPFGGMISKMAVTGRFTIQIKGSRSFCKFEMRSIDGAKGRPARAELSRTEKKAMSNATEAVVAETRLQKSIGQSGARLGFKTEVQGQLPDQLEYILRSERAVHFDNGAQSIKVSQYVHVLTDIRTYYLLAKKTAR